MGSRVVYTPAMQNNQGSDERGKSLLIRSSDGHIFSTFYDHVVQENGGEADRVRMASKWEMSGRAVSEALHWLRERRRHLPRGGGGEVGLHWCFEPSAQIAAWRGRTHVGQQQGALARGTRCAPDAGKRLPTSWWLDIPRRSSSFGFVLLF